MLVFWLKSILTSYRLFVLLTGTALITLPSTGEALHLQAGVNGLIVANDVNGEGHVTEYPSKHASTALQLPFEDGKAPSHNVVGNGPCWVFGRDGTQGDWHRSAQRPLENTQ
jgi:hypothetical protein